MMNEHQKYIAAETREAHLKHCAFMRQQCNSLCIAFITPISYTVTENSPHGHVGQIKQCPAKCQRLESCAS